MLYSLLTLNSSKTEFMLTGLPQQLRKNLWKFTCCCNYFCSQFWLNIWWTSDFLWPDLSLLFKTHEILSVDSQEKY